MGWAGLLEAVVAIFKKRSWPIKLAMEEKITGKLSSLDLDQPKPDEIQSLLDDNQGLGLEQAVPQGPLQATAHHSWP